MIIKKYTYISLHQKFLQWWERKINSNWINWKKNSNNSKSRKTLKKTFSTFPHLEYIFYRSNQLIADYNHIKLTISRNRIASPCPRYCPFCFHRLSPRPIDSFSKQQGGGGGGEACYRIKTRFVHPPSLKISKKHTPPRWRWTTARHGGSWEENRKSRKREVLDFVLLLFPPPPRADKGRCFPRFSHFAHVSAVSQPASPGNSLLIFREIRIKLAGQAEY